MTVDVRPANREDAAAWNRYVEQSPHGTVFHRRESLAALADHAGADLYHLVGYTGQEPVGVFPVFVLRKGPLTLAFSPPPDLRVPYLGPALLNVTKLKQRKAERRQRRFVEGCLDWVDEHVGPAYSHIRVPPSYPDLRPLTWAGFDASPSYTYVVDLTCGTDELLSSFSSDARSNVRDARDDDSVSVTEGGPRAIRTIHEQVRRRYAAQGIDFGLPVGLLLDLHEALPDGTLRPYVCTIDGELVGGIITYEHGDTIGRWQGGVRTGTDLDVAVNDTLDWAVMTDAMERGLGAYDLVGADNERINEYKAKFNPDLREFHSLECGSGVVTVAAHAYRRLQKIDSWTK